MRKLATLARFVALAVAAGPALAQSDTRNPREKIEVTGSSIKRVQEEGALPLQVITREQIDRAGIVSAEQLMEYISANGNGADNLSSQTLISGANDVENRNNAGNATANLRGLGSGSTLVLLNGRRVALHGMKSAAVDLNSIPLAAVQRVEILKDGASAIYGTDAIGGVINFILTRDYEGVQLTGLADVTEAGSGHRYRGSILAGFGNLSRDRFNVMGSLTFDRQEKLRDEDAPFSNGFQPDRGLSPDTVGSPFATQIGAAGTALGSTFVLPGSTQAYNRANLLSFQGNCADRPNQSQYQFALWNAPSFRYACAFDYTGVRVLLQPIDRTNIVSRGTWQISPQVTGFVEWTGSQAVSKNEFEQRQVGANITGFPALLYPVSGPYYQDLSAFIPSFNRNLPIAYRWRCMECGPRIIEADSKATRLLVGLEGEAGDWNWKTGVSTGRSWVQSTLVGGYFYTAPFVAAMNSGLVNPWLAPGAEQTAEARALLNAARADGARWLGGKTGLTQFDASISGELFKLPAGPLAMAVGFDWRREEYRLGGDQPAVADAPTDVVVPGVQRKVSAYYGELAVPILRGLEAQLAVRMDDYNDFGSTTNPKVALSWRPHSTVLGRASWGEGFHAPTFIQLYGGVLEGPVPGNIADPILCPQQPGNPAVCAFRPNARTGGNPNLKPETSEQWSAGIVWEPTSWFNASVDYWSIDRKDLVLRLTPQEVIANHLILGSYIHRNPDGTIDFIEAGLVNAASEITKGIDLGLRFRGNAFNGRWNVNFDGTYVDEYKARTLATSPYVDLVGEWSRRTLHPAWKHTLSANYTTGPWGFNFAQRYVHSYKDERPTGTVPPGFDPEVEAYITYDVGVSYTGIKNLAVMASIRNVLNTDPPFTAHQTDFVSGAGWDPRVADPRGRAFIVRATYTFK
jgi:iron complex outermembrane recepter protein